MHARSYRVAAARAAALIFSAAVAGCGGDGGDAPPAAQASALFVVDSSTATVAGFDRLAPPAGSTTSGRDIATLSVADGPVAYDATHDLLYVAATPPPTAGDPSTRIQVFAHAGSLAAGAAPSRSITLDNTQRVQGMAVDGASDTLWVVCRDQIFTTIDDAIVRRVSPASTATASADFVMTLGHWTEAATYDPSHDIVYASNGAGIVVLAQASAVKYWILEPTLPEFGGGIDGVALTVDPSRDIVYVADGAGSALWLMTGASTATPQLVGPVPLPSAPSSVSVDTANDRLYVGAGGNVYVLAHASMLTPQSAIPAPAITGAAGDRFWAAGATIR